MKKILITGHLGFIFGHLTEYLLKKYDYEITGVDAGTYASNTELHKELNKTYVKLCSLVPYRIETEEFNKIVDYVKPDLIINAAAETHVDNSIKEPRIFLYTNILGVHNVLETCKKFNIPLIHMSTDEVLEHKKPAMPGGPICNPETIWPDYEWRGWKGFYRVKEDGKIAPKNPYAASKAAGEHLVQSYINTYGIDARIVRCTNVYGPRQHKEKFLAKAIQNLSEERPMEVYGKGEQWRDWLYIKDFCTAFDLIMHKGKETVYHIAANDERQNKDVAKLVCNFMNKYPEQYIKFVQDRLGHDYSYSLNCDKLKMLGWEPQYSFGQGLEGTIEYFKANR